MDGERLEVINEQGEVIGTELRSVIHAKGLLHKEVHVWFITPEREIICQRRSKDKDTHPGLLDATVGGHVEIGMSYDDTAVKEVEEETGVVLTKEDLTFISRLAVCHKDSVRNTINNTIRAQYAMLFTGDIASLRIEEGKADGFEKWHMSDMHTLTQEQKAEFIGAFVKEPYLSLYDEIQKKLGL